MSASRHQRVGRTTPCAPEPREGRLARSGLTRPTFGTSAFTLIEIMVVVVLMSVVILGLTAMFTQTQRAFRAGMTQTDVLEAGRMGSEMLSRELEQIIPSYTPTNIFGAGINFLVVNETEFPQSLPANTALRTNLIDRVFFLTHQNQTWTGIGYFLVWDNTVVPGWPIGVLNRFELSDSTVGFGYRPSLMISNFTRAIQGQSYLGTVSRILDGVVSFNFHTYDTNGYSINPSRFDVATNYCSWSYLPNRVDYRFYEKAVPAYVDFELGILEQGALDHYRSIPVSNVQSNYLWQQAGRVHLFRQRVAVRNVDRSAY